jgi:hypothetical protein
MEQKKKKIMVGLPGNSFSNQFLISWTQFTVELITHGEFDISLSPGYSSSSIFTRMKTLGLTSQGVHIKAFDGIDYDVFVTIDPTILFTYEQFKKLVLLTEKYPVVSGYYYLNDKNIHAVEQMDYKQYVRNQAFTLVPIDKINEVKNSPDKMIKVEYTGLGFFACRKNVLQALDYPYFWYPLVDFTLEDGTPCKDVLTEEVAFCKRITDKGYQIQIHSELHVVQEKQVAF